MLLKKKTIIKSSSNLIKDSTLKEVITSVKLNRLMEFNREIFSNDPKHHWGIIREWNEKLFGEFPSPEIHYQMLMLRIQYELVYQAYTEQKIQMPLRINQNYIASKHYDINRLVPSLKGIMESLTKGENMATTVKKTPVVNRVATSNGKATTSPVVKTTNKETVTQTYIRIFQENATKKLSDIQLAAEMVKAHPEKKKYSVADIKSIRSMYNRGALSGQKK